MQIYFLSNYKYYDQFLTTSMWILFLLVFVIPIISCIVLLRSNRGMSQKLFVLSTLRMWGAILSNAISRTVDVLSLFVSYTVSTLSVLKFCLDTVSTSTKVSSSILFFLVYLSPVGFLSLPLFALVVIRQHENFRISGFTFDYLYSLVPLIEDTILVHTTIRGSKTTKAKLSVILLALKRRWKCDSIFLAALDNMETCNISLENVFTTFSTNPISMQSDSLDNLNTLIDNWEAFKNSEAYDHVQKLYILTLASNIFGAIGLDFDKRGYTAMEAEMCKRKIGYGSDTPFLYFLKAAHYIVTSGISIYKTGDASINLFLDGKQAKWYNMQQWLVSSEKFLTNPKAAPNSNDPENLPFSESLFLGRLDDAIDKGQSMQMVIGVKFPKQVAQFRLLVTRLMEMRTNLLSKAACDTTRDLPYSILVAGPPGVGKSTFTNILSSVFAGCESEFKEKNPNDDSYKFVRNFSAKFWDNFKTHMWCLILDDIAFMNVGIAKGGGDPSVNEILKIVNTVPFIPDQASLDDKGRTPLRCELVIGTTNTLDLNASSYFSCPSAALRRFPYVVTTTVKEHLCKQGSTQLDDKKVHPIDDHFGNVPNFWNIEVTHVVVDPSNASRVLRNVVVSTDDISVFTQWYCKTIIQHYKLCAQLKKSSDDLKDIILCSECKGIENHCQCTRLINALPTLQSDSSDCTDNCVVSFLNTAKSLIDDFVLEYCILPLCYIFHFYYEPYELNVEMSNLERVVRRKYSQFTICGYQPLRYESLKIAFVMSFIASVLTVLIKAYNLYKCTNSISMHGGMIPKPLGREKENVWYTKDLPLSNMFVSNKSKCESSYDIKKKISSNIINITLTNDSGSKTVVRALGLKSDIYVTTAHAFDKISSNVIKMEVVSARMTSVDSNTSFNLLRSDFVIKKDIMVFRLKGSSTCKNILEYFPKDSQFRWSGRGCMLTRSYITGDTNECDLINLSWEYSRIGHHDVIGPTYNSSVKLAGGTCGSPVLVDTIGKGSNIIVGIHCAGPSGVPHSEEFEPTSPVKGYSHELSQALLTSMISDLGSFLPLSQNSRPLGMSTRKDELRPLHYKSPLNYIEKGTAKVYGSLPVHRNSSKSAVCAHLCRDFFLSKGYQISHFPPDLNSYKPWRIALLDSTNPVRNINPKTLQLVKDNFMKDILKRVDLAELSAMVHPIPLEHAINGTPGVAFIDSIPRSTSAGYPWNHTKKKVSIILDANEVHSDPITFTPEVLRRVDEIELLYKQEKRASPIFTAHLKDEPVTQKKIDSGKVRVFSGTPLDFTLVIRKQMMGFVRFLQRNRDAFEACPGLIAQSREWHDLYGKLTVFGENKMIAGDFKAFDKTMASEFMLAAFHIIYQVCELSGNFSANDLLIVRGFTTDICNAFTNYNGDLVEFFGSNPSGHPLTVIINSLVNSLYMRYAYAELMPKNSEWDFTDNVVLRTYGDDNVMNSNQSWFNHTSIAKVLGEVGIVYTMADKEAKSVPFIHMKDVSFLKREWRYDNDIDQYLGALEHDSINKMLTTWVRSKSISPEEQALATIQTACREYFFYGKDIFNEKRTLLQEAIVHHNLQFLCSDDLPTWEELLISYGTAHRNYTE